MFSAPKTSNPSQSVTTFSDGLVTDFCKTKLYKYIGKLSLSIYICHPVTPPCPRYAFARKRGVWDGFPVTDLF